MKKKSTKIWKNKTKQKTPNKLKQFPFYNKSCPSFDDDKKKIHGLVLMNEYGLDTDEFVKNRKIIEN